MTTYAALAASVRGAPARLGGTRLVCVDGPAGSGKTTLASRLTTDLGGSVAVVHMDDLYAGWSLDGAADRLVDGVLRPIAGARPGSFFRYDWGAGRFDAVPVPVPVCDVLVVEGCGSCPRSVDAWTTLRIWVEAPQPLRLARGLARDGNDLAERWRRWQLEEAAVFAAENTRARADVRVDGAAPAPAGALVLLDDISPQRAARTMDA